jgi:Immunity protein 50
MSEIATRIVGGEKLTNIFGRWPSFYDPEVHELHFERGHIDTDAQVYEFPRLTVKLHLWLLTNEVDQKGYYVLTNHTLLTMRFYDVDNVKMEGFNHQNAILGLEIEPKNPRGRTHAILRSQLRSILRNRSYVYLSAYRNR